MWIPPATTDVMTGPSVPVDVALAGTVFLDEVYAGLAAPLRVGTEVWATDRAVAPGGIANCAVAAARLGAGTRLHARFGDDAAGLWCAEVLAAEGVSLAACRVVPGWPQPKTVSVVTEADRALLSHQLPVGPGGRVDGSSDQDGFFDGAQAAMAWLSADPAADRTGLRRAAASGTRVFLDCGWDDTGSWDPARLRQLDHAYAFLPNAGEAMAYTRTDSIVAAARRLADRVPLVVVTDGPRGATGIDAATGEECTVPALDVPVRDPTGAGDCFDAGVIVGTLRGWPLRERLAFAALVAGLAVTRPTGSLGAPGWYDLASWWQRTGRADRELAARYGFLAEVLPRPLPGPVRPAPPSLPRPGTT